MEQLLALSINSLGFILCLGAFFIKDGFWLKIAAIVGFGVLFSVNSFEVLHEHSISNMGLVLINTFYLFKLFTHKLDQ